MIWSEHETDYKDLPESQIYYCFSWQLRTALNHQYFLHVSLLELVERCDSFTMSHADHLNDVIISPGLTCHQTFTAQVCTRKYGLLITSVAPQCTFQTYASLNTATLRAKSSFSWHPLLCWMRWHSHYAKVWIFMSRFYCRRDWFMKLYSTDINQAWSSEI